MAAENHESLFMLLWSPMASQLALSHEILPSNFPLWGHVIVKTACWNLMSWVQCFHNMFVKKQKFNTAPLRNGFIYLWTLLHGVTGSKNNKWHFETEISGSKNQEISWSEKEQFPIEDKILTAMLVKGEISNMSYPRRYGSSTVNSLSKKPHTKNSPSLWHHLPLPAPTPQYVGAVGWVCYINLANQANRKQQLRAKVKVKFMLQPAMKEQRGRRSTALIVL